MEAQEATSSEFIAKLFTADEADWNIYVCMNALKADRRIKRLEGELEVGA